MSKFVAFSKSRRVQLLPLTLLTTGFTIYITDLGLTSVPFLAGVSTVPILIMSFISGAFFTAHFSSPNRELDDTLPTNRMRVLRATWFAFVVLGSASFLPRPLCLVTYVNNWSICLVCWNHRL